MILAALPVFTGAYAALVARRVPRRERGSPGAPSRSLGEVVLIGGRGAAADDATLGGDLLVLASALVRLARATSPARMLPPRGLSSLATTLWGVLLGTVVLAPARPRAPRRRAACRMPMRPRGALSSSSRSSRRSWATSVGTGRSTAAGSAASRPCSSCSRISGFVLAALVLGEHVTPPIAVGSALIVGGHRHRPARAEP